MKKETILLIVLILTTIVRAQVPTYQLECILPAPACTSVDLSHDGTKLCARMQYGGWNEGYRVFEADTSDICNYTILKDCGGYAAPWIGRVSTDSKYLYTTLYYNGCVAKIDLSTCVELPRIPVGPWPYGLAFDSQRRYLYVGVNVPGTGTTGSLKVVDTLIDQVTCNVSLGGEPGRCIVVGPNDEFVYLVTQNLGSEVLYKFTAAPGCGVAGTLPLPGVGRGAISVNPDGKTVYVPDVDGNMVHIIDTGTMTVSGNWSIPSAVGFFVSPDGKHALVVGSSPDIRVFDLVTETVVQTISIPDIGTSFDPGKSIPYWDENNGKAYINLCATEGGVAVLSISEPEPLTGRIAFTSDRDGNKEIYLMNVDGSNQIRLTNHSGVDLCPVFSPDGRTIAFISNRSGSYRIYTMWWNGSELHEVPNSECSPGSTSTNGRGLAWSPDGQKFLFKFNPRYDSLSTINLDGSGRTVLLTGGVGVHDTIQGVEWGPTMDDIYFNAHPYSWGYDQHIFHYSISGGNWTQITQESQPLLSHSPKVSTKLWRIVFNRQEGWQGPDNIFTMDIDGGNIKKLTFDEGGILNYTPDWADESNSIIFTSNRQGTSPPTRQVWIMDSTGGNLRMLEGEGNNYAPSWTPMPEPTCTVSDDFEDGVIDTSLWVVGGGKGGSGGCGSGGGQWFNEEKDGYLQARATTPISGNTYGSQAWTRTVHNFNDGRNWIINFKWEADVQSPVPWHADYHLIEITDGRTDWFTCLYIHPTDPSRVLPGTQQLYLSNGVDIGPAAWSIYIDYANRTATLYEGPNGSGTVHSVKTLDDVLPWYVRFITTTATSAGYHAKDCRINLYDFSAVCEPVEPDIDVSPLSHDFGDVELGTSRTVIITISNVGNGDLNVSGIGLETDFTITSAPDSAIVVEPSQTEEVEITYTPSALGYNSAVLKITSDDPDEPVVEVQLSAVGIEIPLPPLEQIANILAFFDTSVDDGTLLGDGPGNSAEKRLNALRNMIEAAGDLIIENELFEEACQQLLDAYRRMDGQPKPPDFVTGEAVKELATMIQELMTTLGC